MVKMAAKLVVFCTFLAICSTANSASKISDMNLIIGKTNQFLKEKIHELRQEDKEQIHVMNEYRQNSFLHFLQTDLSVQIPADDLDQDFEVFLKEKIRQGGFSNSQLKKLTDYARKSQFVYAIFLAKIMNLSAQDFGISHAKFCSLLEICKPEKTPPAFPGKLAWAFYDLSNVNKLNRGLTSLILFKLFYIVFCL